MKLTSKLCSAAILGLGLAAFSGGSASAYVVCNHEGDCWHTDRQERYRDVQVEVHPDSWYFHRDWDNDHDHHWRGHHEGHGYWHNGAWVDFDTH